MISQQELRMRCEEIHKTAEQTKLAQAMISGKLPAKVYKQYLWQFYQITDAIERNIKFDLADMERRVKFAKDCCDCLGNQTVSTLISTNEYCIEFYNMPYSQLKSHLYVHYLGWLYGGQIIKKNLTLPTNHLEFSDSKMCIDYMRTVVLAELTEPDVNEAIRAFERTIEIYNELY